MFNVPQFLDIEDKIVGPLTAKQLGWLGLGGVVMLVFWNFLDTQAFIIAAVIIAGVFGAFAFYRPYSQPLISFLTSSVYYGFRPRMYVWHRLPEKIEISKKGKQKNNEVGIHERKKINENKIDELSKILDQRK
ncbi:MAG TPA: PrgI family protein [Patescibacteria group bacterium]|nr:PrgI family protein [Patescibacteria group bacterium]